MYLLQFTTIYLKPSYTKNEMIQIFKDHYVYNKESKVLKIHKISICNLEIFEFLTKNEGHTS